MQWAGPMLVLDNSYEADADIPAYSDTRVKLEKCNCNQIVTVHRSAK